MESRFSSDYGATFASGPLTEENRNKCFFDRRKKIHNPTLVSVAKPSTASERYRRHSQERQLERLEISGIFPAGRDDRRPTAHSCTRDIKWDPNINLAGTLSSREIKQFMSLICQADE